jgi:glycosyltransferase involved in cell wall biosynthesis
VKPLKILQVSHTFWPEKNGVAEVATKIAAELSSLGHKITVASGFSGSTQEIQGIQTTHFKCRGNRTLGVDGEVDQLELFVAEGSWDVAIVHCAQIWSTDIVLPVLRRKRVPVLFVSHGLSEWENQRYSTYFAWLAEQLRGNTVTISLSKFLEETEFTARYKLEPPVIIPNGVDLSEWPVAPAEDYLNIKPNLEEPYLLSIGNHAQVKGHERLFRLADALHSEGRKCTLSIIGSGYIATRWSLGSNVKIMGGCWYACRLRSLLSRVILRHNLSRQEVIREICKCDLLVVSSHREALPLTILEAMAASKPWVAFDVGGISDLQGGIAVPTEVVFKKEVTSLLQSPERRRELGRIGRRAIEEKFNWKLIVQEYMKIINKFLIS